MFLGKQGSEHRTQPRSRSAERSLQRNRFPASNVVPGVKQSTLKLNRMKPSPPPPPKPLFLVPKQPNPPSSPVPLRSNPSGTVSGLLYYDRNQELVDLDDKGERKMGEENEKEEIESDFDPFDAECQVHRRKDMSSSMSYVSLPTSGNATTFKYV